MPWLSIIDCQKHSKVNERIKELTARLRDGGPNYFHSISNPTTTKRFLNGAINPCKVLTTRRYHNDVELLIDSSYTIFSGTESLGVIRAKKHEGIWKENLYCYGKNDKFLTHLFKKNVTQIILRNSLISHYVCAEGKKRVLYYKVQRMPHAQVIADDQIVDLSAKILKDDAPMQERCDIVREMNSIFRRCLVIFNTPIRPLLFQKLNQFMCNDVAKLTTEYLPKFSEASTLEDAEEEIGIVVKTQN